MDILDAVRIEVGRANAALMRADTQLGKVDPDLTLLETELELASRFVRIARQTLNTAVAKRDS